MADRVSELKKFINWWQTHCRGDEKGEAQIFLDRFFQACGHGGIFEAGGNLEYRIKKGKSTNFADLVWKPYVLIEMKKRGTNLARHYAQAFEYWLQLVPDRPRYTMLCNFDEFWIYDFNKQLEEPVDILKIDEIADRYGSIAFLLPGDVKPVFGNDLIEVTAAAADKVASVFKALINRKVDRVEAQRFVLQCVLAMFAEDTELLPKYMFTNLINDCLDGQSSYDLLGGLFQKMNELGRVQFGRYRNVGYFNGGLFRIIKPIELNEEELILLKDACSEHWGKVKPAIFGTLFEDSMDKGERHAYGAHFTSEADIQKIVLPTIVRPWRAKINNASGIRELDHLLLELSRYKVLDPACGSGNFLYIAYREIKRIEKLIIDKRSELREKNKTKSNRREISFITTHQFYGIDSNEFAVELAKVTMMIAKKLAVDELNIDEPELPLDNLDNNIICGDALFMQWPEVNTIIGNPPFQSKNKMQQEFGVDYLNRLRSVYKRIPGRADYCVYWFRKAHEVMKNGDRAGLVGTNTIRQNYSRVGGLDFIVENDGTITEAVSSQPWSGDASVNVSIVNWIKGKNDEQKVLYTESNGQQNRLLINHISSSLSDRVDLSKAKRLQVNIKSKGCYQGQTHGHKGFLLKEEEVAEMLRKEPHSQDVIYPFLTATDLLTGGIPSRYVIDFFPRNINESSQYKIPFERIKQLVLPDRLYKHSQEVERNKELLKRNPKAKVNLHHRNFLNQWWQLSYPRGELIEQLSQRQAYIVCSRVTKRPIFEFVNSSIRPNDSLAVFPFDDFYSFGVIQSSLHWMWFFIKCSTLTERFRYTSDTVFDTFPWPQEPTKQQVEDVIEAAAALKEYRDELRKTQSLRSIYRILEMPGKNKLKNLHAQLDRAVFDAYNFELGKDTMLQMLELNTLLYSREIEGKYIVGPGPLL